MSIISSPKNSLKKSIGGLGFDVSLKVSSRRSWNRRGGLSRDRALKPGLNGTTALSLIVTCNSRS
jgi:hypothetical protein